MPFADVIAQIQPHSLFQVLNNWSEDGFDFLRHDVPRIIGIIFVSFVLIHFLRVLRKRLVNLSKREAIETAMRATQLRTMASVVYSVGLTLVFFVAGMQILEVLKINIAPLLASAGIAGLAVGFGAQTLVRDVINGFFILIESQFDIGDVIKVGPVQGTVEKLTLRRTVLRDADGTLHNVPNSQISIVSNMTRDWTQLAMHVSVSYNENSDRMIALLKEVAAEVQHDPAYADLIVGDPAVPGIEKVSAEEVDYLLLVKTKPGQQYEISRQLRRRIKECFEKNNVQPGGQHRFYVIGDAASPPKT
ncbi:MAG: mechanosensitive ion channel family protein [Candidatus Korobacteraceae bacterium]|jgi:small conductance mechanosensitive channel